MATTPSNNPASPPAAPKPKPAAAPSPGGSNVVAISPAQLESALVQRGLATQPEVNTCKEQRAKLGKSDGKTLIDLLIQAKYVTNTQALRLIKDLSVEVQAQAQAQKSVRIPGFEVIEVLGKGSMGMVYKAKQTSLDRVVALKVLLDNLAANKEFISRFQREAKIAGQLNHNNIVNVYDAGSVDGRHYFAMEYVQGKTVKEDLDSRKRHQDNDPDLLLPGRYPEKEGLRIITAIAEALKHAHDKGLVHRDIKPENIILTKEGGVKLADLGLARPTNDEAWAKSEKGMAIGTPYYISPEQVRGQTDIDIRADIYSLGATFYHMMTGRVPFDGSDPNEVMKKHVNKKIELKPVDHINDEVSGGLGAVVETMMARDRASRYQSPADLLVDLYALSRGDRPVIADQGVNMLSDLASGEGEENQIYEASDDVPSPRSLPINRSEPASSQSSSGSNTFLITALVISAILNLVLILFLATSSSSKPTKPATSSSS